LGAKGLSIISNLSKAFAVPKLKHAFVAAILLVLAGPQAVAQTQIQPDPKAAAAPAATEASPQPQAAPVAPSVTPSAPAANHAAPAEAAPTQSQKAPAQPQAPAQTDQAPVQPAAAAPGAAPAQPAATTPEAAPPPPAQPVLSPEVNSTIKDVVEVMDTAEKRLSEISNANTDLGKLRDKIDDVISKTTQTADSLRPQLADIQRQIDKLGPAPAEGAPPESQSVGTERARLAARSSELSGAIKTLEVTWWRARQAIDKITNLRLQLFVQSLTQRIASPLFPELWTDLIRGLPSVRWRIDYNAHDFWSSVSQKKASVSVLLAGALALYFLLKIGVLAAIRYRPKPDATPPTFFERAASASWITPARAIPAAGTALLLYAGFDYLDLLYNPTTAPAGLALLRSTLIFVGVSALVSAVFAPRRPERRLVLLSSPSAARIARWLKALALIYSIDLFLSAFGKILYFPLSISVVQSLITSIAFALVLIGLLLTPFETSDADPQQPVPRGYPLWLKVPLWLAAASIIVCCLIGYVALGRFLAQQLVMTGVVGLVAILLYLAIRAYTRGSTTSRSRIGILLEEHLGFSSARRKQLAWLTETFLTLCVAFAIIPVLMLQWGFSGADVRDWLKSLLFGFEIGQFRISLARIFVGVAIFVALLLATRVVQRRLRDNVLNKPRMDSGIANSIDTTAGYAGTALAAIVAISYAGFDITNLAIVAGALSVGIGFGLQSIVNNFVSGLILLIERPIKVGDWVVVGDQQGTVRRISVRSTEIETFDRASLIVPNSELITGRVLNWTHRNVLGRVVMKFRVAPGVEPRHMLAVLTECANRHPGVLREPAPLAVFESSDLLGTEYSLRILLPDINCGLQVQSELRVAVHEALQRPHAVESAA
jgi:small-conductance mechanosensitive channel